MEAIVFNILHNSIKPDERSSEREQLGARRVRFHDLQLDEDEAAAFARNRPQNVTLAEVGTSAETTFGHPTESRTNKRTSNPDLPPYQPLEAKTLLVAQKISGKFREGTPTLKECEQYLRKHFRGIPSGPHRKVVREIWPSVTRGPRKKIGAKHQNITC